MINKSRQHLQDTDERYFQHLWFALRFAGACLLAGTFAFIHALIPAYFQTAASQKIKNLATRQRPKN